MRTRGWLFFAVLVACSGDSEPEASNASEAQAVDESTATEAIEPAAEEPAAEELIAAVSDPVPAEDTPPTTDSPDDWVSLLRAAGASIRASSLYRDDPAQLTRLTDGNFSTAWNSATMAADDTTPQSITVTLPQGVQVHAIQLTAGYTHATEESDLFTANRRIKHIRIRHADAVFEFDLDIAKRDLQQLDVEGGGGEWVIELTEWEAGEREDWRELIISELRVLGEAGTVALGPGVGFDAVEAATEEEMRRAAAGFLRREYGASGSVLGRALPLWRAEFRPFAAEDSRALVEVHLEPSKCYAFVGRSTRRAQRRGEVADPIADDEAPLLNYHHYEDQGSSPGWFFFGYDEGFCAQGSRTVSFALSDVRGIGLDVMSFEVDDPDIRSAAFGADAAPPTPVIEAELTQREGLHLTELVLTTDIVENRPLTAESEFSKEADEQVHCYFRLENPTEEATLVTLAWEDESGTSRSGPREIQVPARRRFSHYRHTSTGWRRTGRYQCVVRDNAGVVLGRRAFILVD